MNEDQGKVVEFPPAGEAASTIIENAIAPDQAVLREKVRRVMEAEGLSQNAIAKEANIAPATLSQWMNANYPGDTTKVATKVAQWLSRRGGRQQLQAIMPPKPDFIETPTARRIFDTLQYAKDAADFALIVGGAGMGKTTTLRHFQASFPNVWIATATPATASVVELLQEIAMALGLRECRSHPAWLQRTILQHIRDRNGLLVIDEANHMPKPTLEMCRSLHDLAQVGLVMSGNQSVHRNIYNGGKNGFAQIFSRVGKQLILRQPKAEDVRAIAAAFGIAGRPEVAKLGEIAERGGALRSVVKVIRLAAIYAKGAAVTVAHLAAAERDLGTGLAPVDPAHA
jgi:DNA transposition AAA+ family ATPase